MTDVERPAPQTPVGAIPAHRHPGAPDPGAPATPGADSGRFRWHPGDHVAARRALVVAVGGTVDAGTKGMVIAVSSDSLCTVRFHSGVIVTGLDFLDIVVVHRNLRC